ncbi:hypothetical protein AB1Z15_000509 [Vibrio parahaemolyticus]
MESLNIEIIGDYVDSYIYSGNLILVGSDYVLRTYRWDDLIDEATDGIKYGDRQSILNISKDSTTLSDEKTYNLEIKEKLLKKHFVSKIELGVWPTDIGIMSNWLYISSENGIDHVYLNYLTGQLGHMQRKSKLFDSMAFFGCP